LQRLPTQGAQAAKHFQADGTHYLVVAEGVDSTQVANPETPTPSSLNPNPSLLIESPSEKERE
jgi:hypothetical protein